MPASSTKRWSFSRVILPSLNLPTRIFGPCRSHRMATVRPTLLEISFTSAARFRWSSAVPCEKLRRTTSTPARTMRSRIEGSDDAGPSVATILVERNMVQTLKSQLPMCNTNSRAGTSRAIQRSRSCFADGSAFSWMTRLTIRAGFEGRDRGECLAFEELEKRPAGGRNVVDLVRDAVLIDSGHGVAAARNREALGGGDRARERLRAVRIRLLLEHADRTVPDDRARFRKLRRVRLGGLRTDVEDHVVARHRIDGLGLRVRVV